MHFIQISVKPYKFTLPQIKLSCRDQVLCALEMLCLSEGSEWISRCLTIGPVTSLSNHSFLSSRSIIPKLQELIYFLTSWAYFHSTREFHCDNPIDVYSVFWTSSPLYCIPLTLFLPPPPFYKQCLVGSLCYITYPQYPLLQTSIM
jgi:hypothetical protein